MPSWQRRFSLDVPCPVRAPSAAHPESYPDGGTTCVLLPLLYFNPFASTPAAPWHLVPTLLLRSQSLRQSRYTGMIKGKELLLLSLLFLPMLLLMLFSHSTSFFPGSWGGGGSCLLSILSIQFTWHPHENVDHLRVAPVDNFMALPEGLMHLGW